METPSLTFDSVACLFFKQHHRRRRVGDSSGHQQVSLRNDRHPQEEQLRNAGRPLLRRLRRQQTIQTDGATNPEGLQHQLRRQRLEGGVRQSEGREDSRLLQGHRKGNRKQEQTSA